MSLKAKPFYILQKVNPLTEIQEAMDIINKKWLENHYLSDNKILHHYTTLSGLKGIIERRCIQSTSILAMNDPQEKTYGKNIIIKLFDKEISKTTDENFISFFSTIKDNLIYFGDIHYQTYITCFCEDDNLLSQWRTYAKNGDGYNLGIKFNEQTKFSHLEPTDDIKTTELILRKVIYKNETQVKLVTEIIELLKNALVKFIANNNELLPTKISQAAVLSTNIFFDLVWTFKNPFFAEEKEWRLIKTRAPQYESTEMKFREDAFGIVPYLDTYIFEKIEDRQVFPIDSIKYGPSLDPSRTRSSIDCLLHYESTRNNDIKINPGNIKIESCGYEIR